MSTATPISAISLSRQMGRLAALIRQLAEGFRYLKPQIVHRLVDGSARARPPHRAAKSDKRDITRQAQYKQTDHFIHVADASSSGIRCRCFSTMRSRINSDFAR
jgi:hypothetical protein